MNITKHDKSVAKLPFVGASKDDFKKFIQDIKGFQSNCNAILGLDWKMLRDERWRCAIAGESIGNKDRRIQMPSATPDIRQTAK